MSHVCRLGTGEGPACTEDCITSDGERCPLLPSKTSELDLKIEVDYPSRTSDETGDKING